MRADIHDGQENKRSMQGPDTEAQDHPPFVEIRLAMHSRRRRRRLSDLRIAPVHAIRGERRCSRQDNAELGELTLFRVDVN
jgi:hypothetical protein